MKRILIFTATMAFATLALGQQYKWVDKDGRVQYGDAPPPGVSATRLKGSPAAPAAPAAEPQTKGPLTPAEQEAAFRKRQQEAGKERDKQAQADQQAQAKRDNCARAQQNLSMLESGQRIARTDAKGERYYLDDAQVSQEAARARQTMQQACN
ncbi:MAG: DUF4124 domain-containing protein [Pseudomonadota bacterium]|nr:DUF4124 domain-containing protein [Pseudomonadota bacterium]